MSRRNTPVVITTMGQRPGQLPRGRFPRRRISLGGAVATGFALLLVYGVVSLLFHILVATALWLPAIIVAGYATNLAARKGIYGGPRLLIGIVVLIAVRAALLAI